MESANQLQEENASNSSSRKHDIWNHFKKGADDGCFYCVICNQAIKTCGKTTSTFRRHWASHEKKSEKGIYLNKIFYFNFNKI